MNPQISKNYKIPNKHAGFTIIGILIALAIMAILTYIYSERSASKLPVGSAEHTRQLSHFTTRSPYPWCTKDVLNNCFNGDEAACQQTTFKSLQVCVGKARTEPYSQRWNREIRSCQYKKLQSKLKKLIDPAGLAFCLAACTQVLAELQEKEPLNPM